MRGKVRVRGIHEAPIQWPYTLPEKGGGRPMLILCGDLARAVRVESETAICHWWGVGITTVWKWRKALGVERTTEGTVALLSRLAPETVQSEKAVQELADAVDRLAGVVEDVLPAVRVEVDETGDGIDERDRTDRARVHGEAIIAESGDGCERKAMDRGTEPRALRWLSHHTESVSEHSIENAS
jgi:hypothetical protein